jgi:DNA-binding MarR family transcriptional regulator
LLDKEVLVRAASNRPPDKDRLEALLKFPEVQSWRALMSAFQTIFSALEKGLMAEGCSVSRFQILFYLYFEGDKPAVQIARKMLVTRGNISMFLRRMEADGLVRKKATAVQKRPVYSLTTKGRTFFEKILPPHIERVRLRAPKLNAQAIKRLWAAASPDDPKTLN